MSDWYVGIGLGGKQQRTAIVAVEKRNVPNEPLPVYAVHRIAVIDPKQQRRAYRGTERVLDDLLRGLEGEEGFDRSAVTLVVDETATGGAFTDIVLARLGLAMRRIIVVSEGTESAPEGVTPIAKRVLISNVGVLDDYDRMNVFRAAGLSLLQSESEASDETERRSYGEVHADLTDELGAFGDADTPWRERSGRYPDVVLAIAITVYVAERDT